MARGCGFTEEEEHERNMKNELWRKNQVKVGERSNCAIFFFSFPPRGSTGVAVLSSPSLPFPHPIAITIVAFLATFPLSPLPSLRNPKKKAEVSPHSRKKGKRGVGRKGEDENHDAALAPKMDGDGRGWTYDTTDGRCI